MEPDSSILYRLNTLHVYRTRKNWIASFACDLDLDFSFQCRIITFLKGIETDTKYTYTKGILGWYCNNDRMTFL